MKLLGRALSIAIIVYCAYLGALLTSASAEAASGEASSGNAVEILPTTSHAAGIASIDVGPDRNLVLSTSMDLKLKLWDLASGRLIRTINSPVPLSSAAISQDGRSAIAAAYDKTNLLQLDVAAGTVVREFKREKRHFLCFSGKTGEALVYDGAEANLNIVDLSSDRVVRALETSGWDSNALVPAAFAPDGKTLLIANNNGEFVLSNVASGKVVRTFNGYAAQPRTITFSADGRTVLTVNGHSNVATAWDVATGHSIQSLKSDVIIWTAALSPDGRTAWLGRNHADVQAWDVASGKLVRTWAAQQRSITALAPLTDRLTILTGGDDGNSGGGRGDFSFNMWRVADGTLLRRFAGRLSVAQAFAITPDGRTALLGTSDALVRQVDLNSGRLVRSFAGHTGAVTSVALTPDGRTGLSESGDATLRLWDLAGGHAGRTIGSDLDMVNSIALSPDGRTVLAGQTTTGSTFGMSRAASRCII